MTAATITHLHPAQKLNLQQGKTLALEVLQNKKTIFDIAQETQVSRRFLYEQKNKATAAIDSKFSKSNEDYVLFKPIPNPKIYG